MPIFRQLHVAGRSYALTLEQRNAVRKRFESMARSKVNFAAVAHELRVSSRTIERCVRGR